MHSGQNGAAHEPKLRLKWGHALSHEKQPEHPFYSVLLHCAGSVPFVLICLLYPVLLGVMSGKCLEGKKMVDCSVIAFSQ